MAVEAGFAAGDGVFDTPPPAVPLSDPRSSVGQECEAGLVACQARLIHDEWRRACWMLETARACADVLERWPEPDPRVVAAALGWSVTMAAARLETAVGALERLPRLGVAWCEGWLEQAKVAVFVAGLRDVTDEQASVVVDRLIEKAPKWGVFELGQRVAAAVADVDPWGAENRRAAAVARARVSTRIAGSGAAEIHGLDLDSGMAVPAFERIVAIADEALSQLKAAGCSVGAAKVQAQVYLRLLHGCPHGSDDLAVLEQVVDDLRTPTPSPDHPADLPDLDDLTADDPGDDSDGDDPNGDDPTDGGDDPDGGPNDSGPSDGGPDDGDPDGGGPSVGGPSDGGPSDGGPSDGGPSDRRSDGPRDGGGPSGGAPNGHDSHDDVSDEARAKEATDENAYGDSACEASDEQCLGDDDPAAPSAGHCGGGSEEEPTEAGRSSSHALGSDHSRSEVTSSIRDSDRSPPGWQPEPDPPPPETPDPRVSSSDPPPELAARVTERGLVFPPSTVRTTLATALGLSRAHGRLPVGALTGWDAHRAVWARTCAQWRVLLYTAAGDLEHVLLVKAPHQPGADPRYRRHVVELTAHTDEVDALDPDQQLIGIWAELARRTHTALAAARARPTDEHPARTTREANNRFPGAELSRWVQSRDRTCRFPMSTIPAVACPIDHTWDHVLGGPTQADNLGPLSISNHLRKHDPLSGWTVRQTRPGDFVWTAPTGTHHIVDSEPYRPLRPIPRDRFDHGITDTRGEPRPERPWRPRKDRHGRLTDAQHQTLCDLERRRRRKENQPPNPFDDDPPF